LEGYFGGSNRYGTNLGPVLRRQASNRSTLVSAGPFDYIAPGDSLNIVFAIVCAKKFGTEPAEILIPQLQKNKSSMIMPDGLFGHTMVKIKTAMVYLNRMKTSMAMDF
jgi:hypothetical protein